MNTQLVAYESKQMIDGTELELSDEMNYKLTILEVEQTRDGTWFCQQKGRTIKVFRLFVDGKCINM